MRILQTPPGVKDYLPAECEGITLLDETLSRLFSQWAYKRVETPLIEYLDIYLSSSLSDADNAYKFTDHNGRLLCLRPDITTSVARMAAAKTDTSTPQRYFYIGDTVTFANKNERAQRRQAGVELLGEGSAEADAEVIALAIESLLAAGLCNFQLELSEVNFFRGLAQEAGLQNGQLEKLRELVEEKNSLELELFLKPLPIEGKLRDLLGQLPYLYGNADLLNRAELLSAHPLCRQALQRCRFLSNTLEAYGYAQYLTFDFGMVKSLSYYTGIIFQAIVPGLAEPVLKGGRYDGLLAEFGSPAPAVGFALMEYELLEAAKPVKNEKEPLLLAAAPAMRAEAFAKAEAWRKQGKQVLLQFCEKDEWPALCRRYKATSCIYLGTMGEEEAAL